MIPPGEGPVVDCGAGTGLLTRALTDVGLDVIAVDPDPRMLTQLRASTPVAAVYEGTGESMPLPDKSARVICFGQAWHWVDPVQASREADRVLWEDGSLILIWNIRNEEIEWVRTLSEIISRSPSEELIFGPGPTVMPPFHLDALETVGWFRTITPDTLREFVKSRSPYLSAPPDVQRSVEAAVEDLITNHPDLQGKQTIDLPYQTFAYRYGR